MDTDQSGRRIGDLLKFEQVAADYFATFDPTSEEFDSANVGLIPTALGLRDAIADYLHSVDTPLKLSVSTVLNSNGDRVLRISVVK